MYLQIQNITAQTLMLEQMWLRRKN